jgi:AcrR family transcriptional regulator
VDVALKLIGRLGYRGATIRGLAAAVGLSKTGLLHHFGTREELLAEVLRQRDTAGRARIEEREGPAPDISSWLPATARDNVEVPGLIELYVRLSAEATEPGHPAREFFVTRYRQTRAVMAVQLADLQRAGRLPAEVDPERLASVILAVQEGLQLQWLYERDRDMAEALADFVTVLGLDRTPDGDPAAERRPSPPQAGR